MAGSLSRKADKIKSDSRSLFTFGGTDLELWGYTSGLGAVVVGLVLLVTLDEVQIISLEELDISVSQIF